MGMPSFICTSSSSSSCCCYCYYCYCYCYCYYCYCCCYCYSLSPACEGFSCHYEQKKKVFFFCSFIQPGFCPKVAHLSATTTRRINFYYFWGESSSLQAPTNLAAETFAFVIDPHPRRL